MFLGEKQKLLRKISKTFPNSQHVDNSNLKKYIYNKQTKIDVLHIFY